MNNEIPVDIYRETLTESWNVGINLNDSFPPAIRQWINTTSKKLGVPFLYIGYPLLTAVAHLLGQSEVEVTDDYREPVIIYSLVSGRSGTNKSGSLAVIRRLLESINGNKSAFDTGTLEGLMSQFREQNGTIISMVDEFSTFMDALDKNGTGNSERSRYLSLWSGIPWSKRTKNGGLEQVKCPRLQFTGFNQNWYLMNMMSMPNYDGFMARFLVATPSEVYIPLSEKLNAKNDAVIDMKAVLMNVQNLFKDGHQFHLTTQAMEIFEDFHDNFVLKTREENKFEDAKTMILSKAVGNILRVAAVQCAMRIANTSNEEEADLLEDAQISAEDIKRAETIVKYSVKCLSILNDGKQRNVRGRK